LFDQLREHEEKMADVTALLQQLGFSEYEARAYLALLQRSPLNGYELAKVSGLPRANVYAVLQKLEERGAVVRLDMPSGARYAPVAPTELTQRIANRFQDVLSAAQQALEAVVAPGDTEYVWNIQGYAAVLDHAHALIDATQERLLVAIGRQEASALAEPLARAEARGVAVTTLCLDECAVECGGCRGTICRSCATVSAAQRWLVLVSDDAEALAGEIGVHDDALGVRTRQRLQVDLASWYIRHSMALTAVLSDLSKRPDQMLEPETRAILRSIDSRDRQGGWLDLMRAIIQRDVL
jgi:HTH-type transcriptional regulator, sugar sensing transcriptional regulator